MKERIAEFIREKAYRPMTFAELATSLGVGERQTQQLKKTLEQMESVGEVVLTRTDRYGAPERMNLVVGRLQGHPRGFGFVVPDAPEGEDVFVGRESLNGAWHGDRVIARLESPARAGGRAEGEIIRILNRANQRVVGTFDGKLQIGYVTPDDRRLGDDIYVPKGATNGAKTGEKVVVQIVRWPEARRNAEGKIVERIGMKGQVGVDIVSVIRKFGLPEVFPARVLKDAEAVPETVTPEALAEPGRRDLRNLPIVTIDGEDAKDLDDAVFVERTRGGHFRLGVHIADVAYYVAEGSTLDREAYNRATSVYLADRVVPMLPPRLSNGICSLNSGVDRLTLSCVMEIDQHGKVLKYEIFPSVIKTAARMTYTKVNEILAGDAAATKVYEPLVPMFRLMHELMTVLRQKRERRGALDFDLPEAKVKLNEDGWPVEIRRVERGVAERIIEEFMLVANETVAEHCNRLGVPFMYRVHGEPAPDRLAGLRDFLGLFGYSLKLPREGAVAPKLLQGIIDWSKERTESNLVASVLLRTMRQAVYSEENLGHFGLAADYYCHFTSPIRRYPDLVVHRVLRATFVGTLPARTVHKWETWIPEAARQSSDRERLAMEAERETIDLKKAEFMSDKVGERFEGVISGVGQFGFFVQLPTTVEGLVHVSTLTDDYYHFHEQFYALIGERTRRRFRLGDPVVVRLGRVDVDNRQVDFALDDVASPLVTVVAAPGEARNRAAKKRAMAEPTPRVVASAGRAGGKGGRPADAQAAPVAAQAEKVGRKRRRRKGKRGGAGLAQVESIAPPAAMPERAERLAPPAAAPAPAAAAQAAPPAVVAPMPEVGGGRKPGRGRTGQTAATQREAAAPKASSVPRGGRVDMWGVPLPAGRTIRVFEENDPLVTNPYAINMPARDGGGGRAAGGRGRSPRKETPPPMEEAPFTPAPGTADEASGLPGVADGGPPRRGGGRSRRPRGRTRGGNEQGEH